MKQKLLVVSYEILLFLPYGSIFFQQPISLALGHSMSSVICSSIFCRYDTIMLDTPILCGMRVDTLSDIYSGNTRSPGGYEIAMASSAGVRRGPDELASFQRMMAMYRGLARKLARCCASQEEEQSRDRGREERREESRARDEKEETRNVTIKSKDPIFWQVRI